MTPNAVHAASEGLTRLRELEKFLEDTEASRLVVTVTYGHRHLALPETWAAEQIRQVVLDMAERQRSELRDLGVVFDISDAVMPELRNEVRYAYGPWVTPLDTKMPPLCMAGEYQQASTETGWVNPTIFEKVEALGHSVTTKYRRVYRIGEWFDHDGSAEPALEPGTLHDYVNRLDGNFYGDRVAAGESWAGVKRFRPL